MQQTDRLLRARLARRIGALRFRMPFILLDDVAVRLDPCDSAPAMMALGRDAI
jgi:hypothetical protein